MALLQGQNWIQRLAAELLGIRYMQDGGTLLVDGEQQPREYDTLNAVYPLRAAANHPDGRFDLSIEPAALIPSVPTARTAYVDGVNGADVGPAAGIVGQRTRPFLTIEAALDAVLLLGPSTSNPYLIDIHPGTYSEVPLTIFSGVTMSGRGASTVISSDAAAALVTLQANATITDLTLSGASSAGGIGVLIPASAEPASVIDCIVTACETGISVESPEALIVGCVVLGDDTMVRGIEARTGALIRAADITIQSVGSFISDGNFVADGGNIQLGAQSYSVSGERGLYALNGGGILSSGCLVTGCDKGLHVPSSGGSIEISNSGALQSVTEDVLVESASATLTLASFLHEKPLNIAAGAKVLGDRFDRTGGQIVTEGDACVGAVGRPGLFAAGSGCASNEGITAFHFDGVSTYTDVTAELTSPTGSAIDLVPGLGPGNSLLIGAPQPFAGLELLVTLIQTGGALAVEYWKSGAGFTGVDWMLSRDNKAYGNELFANTGVQDQRLGDAINWVASVENGVNAHWFRFNVTGALTTAPRLEQLKLHYNYARITGNGVIEVFGDEEPEHEIDVDLAKWTAEAGASLPNNVTLPYSGNVSKTVPSFPSSTPRGQSYELDYPADADASRPMKLILEASSSDANTNTYVLALYHVRVPPGSTLNGGLAGELSELKIVTPTGTANQTQLLTYEILRPEAISGTDRLCLTLRRETNDANDTHTGAVQVSKATLLYRRWKP
jgi:hypothetical protein